MWEVRIDGYKLVENSEDKWDVSSMTVEGRLASILSSRNIQVRCCGQQLPTLLAKWVLLRSKLKKAYLFGKEVSLSLYIYIYTSSTAQGGGGSFKNRKPIGEVGCCESGMAERSHWWTERCLRSPLFLSLSLFFSLFLYLSLIIYLPTYWSVCLPIYLSVCLSISLSIYLPIYLAV